MGVYGTIRNSVAAAAAAAAAAAPESQKKSAHRIAVTTISTSTTTGLGTAIQQLQTVWYRNITQQQSQRTEAHQAQRSSLPTQAAKYIQLGSHISYASLCVWFAILCCDVC
jgi:hypothetical protein